MHDEKPRLKISDNPEKLLWPGVKKVCRYYDEEGYFHYDGVALHDEHEPVLYEQNLPMRKIAHTRQEELMIPVMESGKVTVEAQDPYTIARYVSQRKQLLREEYKRLENPHRYRVGIGGELQALRLKLLNDHKIITDSNESTIDR